MKCPFCGFNNMQGSDECEVCLADLMSLDGLAKKSARNEFIHKVLDLPLSSLKPRVAVSIKPEATVAKIIELMNEIKAGCVLVENSKGKLVGIVTERDILKNLSSNLKDLNHLKVSDIMTTNVEALKSDNSLNQALHQMAVKKFRHLVIYNSQGKRCIVSTRDLMKHLSQFLKVVGIKTSEKTKKTNPKKTSSPTKKKSAPVKKKPAKKTKKSSVKKPAKKSKKAVSKRRKK